MLSENFGVCLARIRLSDKAKTDAGMSTHTSQPTAAHLRPMMATRAPVSSQIAILNFPQHQFNMMATYVSSDGNVSNIPAWPD